ncbi:Ubl-specific protease [Fusarium heterosporum]|uniref:Ubl-specific protease n=1 Tax=Fusarium heterosporum TaxID=42747 RepID=A0A8H5SUM4_FUSHE|nr:Ubl-specific protease [Fusarium heterosporum]
MSFSLHTRISMHQSANQTGSPAPAHLLEAAQRQRQLRITPKQTHTNRQLPPPKAIRFTTPPRRIRRPNARLLIDSPLPRTEIFEDPALRDRFVQTDSPVKSLFLERPPRAKTIDPDVSKTPITTDHTLVVVDGIQTRKRRAQDTEIELVAAENGITNIKVPVITLRAGETAPNKEPGQKAYNANPMLGILSNARSITRMITSIYSAFSGIGETISRLIRPQSYQIAEFRSYLSENQFSNKRIKIGISSDDTASENVGNTGDNELRWVDRNSLTTLMEDYKTFSKSLAKVWECLERGTREEANKDLTPLSTNIVDNNDRAVLYSSESYDLTEIFALQLRRIFQYMDKVYEIGIIIKIRDSHEFVPPVLDYGLFPDFVANLESIKHFLSGPALPVVCNDILRKHGEHEWKVSQSFLDRIVLDIKAILRNLPAPSYVDSQDYRDRLQAMFPTPPRTDLNMHLLLPGSFPEFDELKDLIDEPTRSQVAQPLVEQASAEVVLAESEPETSQPIIARPQYYKKDFLRVDLAQKSISQISSEDYRHTFYEESDEHRIIKDKYITEFEPKFPLSSNEAGSLRSILRNRRKHPSKVTPKRLGIMRRPKVVSFVEGTVSPRPRTHLGLDVPKKINYNRQTGEALPPTVDFQEQRPSWTRRWLNLPTTQIEESRKESIFASSTTNSRRRHLEEKDGLDPDARIKELFALPSLRLPISDDSKAGIEFKIQAAKRKAAEEARLAAEEKARQELEARLARSGGLRMPKRKFIASVSPDWHRKALDTLRAAPSASLAKSAEGVDLRRHDFAKVVAASEWLNDEIVNASLLWLDRAINSAAGIKDVKRSTRKCFTLGSFFFKRLQDQGVQGTQRTLRRYGVEKRNFLDIDTILLPICEHSHWTLLVIRPSKRTIAHMDSINSGGNSSYTNRAVAWVKDVLEEKFNTDEWGITLHEAPLQNNGHDCGVHTITNAMCVSLGLNPIDSYTASDMPKQRIRIACMLLNGGFTGDFDLRIY